MQKTLVLFFLRDVQENFDQSTVVSQQSLVKPKLLLQIHDSLLVECRKEDAKKVGDLLKETMEGAYTQLPVKLTVDVSHGQNWGEL